MKCKTCGTKYRIFDCYCRECGTEREKAYKEPANEKEGDFALHTEYYGDRDGSGRGSDSKYHIATEFSEYDGTIYAREKNAIVRISADGKHEWILPERADEIPDPDTGYSFKGRIYADSAGLFIRVGETKYFFYDHRGAFINEVDFGMEGVKEEELYVFGDKMYVLYQEEIKKDRGNAFIVEYDVPAGKSRRIFDLMEVWGDLSEYMVLSESYLAEEIEENPDCDFWISSVHIYRFAVNSRRAVVSMIANVETSLYGHHEPGLWFDINLETGEIFLNPVLSRQNITFLDMKNETLQLCLGYWKAWLKFPLDYTGESTKENAMSVWEPERNPFDSGRMSYWDGENCYVTNDYNISAIDRSGNQTKWESYGWGDACALIRLGNLLYERHGSSYDDAHRSWYFYKLKQTPELVFKISEQEKKEEYAALLEQAEGKRLPFLYRPSAPSEEPVVEEALPVSDVPERSYAPISEFCTECGTKVVPGAKFCYKCGNKLI